MPAPPMIQETDYSGESDADLLTLISWRKEGGDIARQAWGELYSRYFRSLSLICLKKYGNQLGVHGVEDLVSETFIQVFNGGADKFHTKETDPKKQRNHIGAWLGVIAHRLFLQRLRDRQRLAMFQFEDGFDPKASTPAPKELDFDFPVNEEPISPERIEQSKRLQTVLDGLKGEERIILLTRFDNYQPSGGKQQFREGDLDQLVNDLGLTKDNIRQIVHRTFKKARNQLLGEVQE